MAVDPVPYFVGGGAEHSSEIVRQAFHDSTGGAEGVSSPGALKVAADTPPGTSVRVFGGGATLLNRYAKGEGQSYSVRNTGTTRVLIKATGSASARTDMVIIRVLDPNYEGATPPNPNDFQYTRIEVIEGISAGVETASELNLGYPAIALAKISLPKSTATVAESMITNLRVVAQPKIWPELRTYALTGEDSENLATKSDDPNTGETWPRSADSTQERIWIPETATRVKIVMLWGQVATPGIKMSGRLWVQVGSDDTPGVFSTQTVKYSTDTSTARQTIMVADMKWIPEEIRGTWQKFIPRGNRATASGTGAYLVLDGSSAVALQVEMMERAD